MYDTAPVVCDRYEVRYVRVSILKIISQVDLGCRADKVKAQVPFIVNLRMSSNYVHLL